MNQRKKGNNAISLHHKIMMMKRERKEDIEPHEKYLTSSSPVVVHETNCRVVVIVDIE